MERVCIRKLNNEAADLPNALILFFFDVDNAIDYEHLMQDFLEALNKNTHYRGAIYNIDNGLAIYEKLIDKIFI